MALGAGVGRIDNPTAVFTHAAAYSYILANARRSFRDTIAYFT
jgi:hypothetical protein